MSSHDIALKQFHYVIKYLANVASLEFWLYEELSWKEIKHIMKFGIEQTVSICSGGRSEDQLGIKLRTWTH